LAGWQGAGAGSVGRTGQAGGVDTGADGSRAGAGTFCAIASGRSCSYLSLGVPTRSLACTTGRNPLVAALIAGRAASAASRNLRRWNPCALFANVECILGHWVTNLGAISPTERRVSSATTGCQQGANRPQLGMFAVTDRKSHFGPPERWPGASSRKLFHKSQSDKGAPEVTRGQSGSRSVCVTRRSRSGPVGARCLTPLLSVFPRSPKDSLITRLTLKANPKTDDYYRHVSLFQSLDRVGF
jgi:hypothetical protein